MNDHLISFPSSCQWALRGGNTSSHTLTHPNMNSQKHNMAARSGNEPFASETSYSDDKLIIFSTPATGFGVLVHHGAMRSKTNSESRRRHHI